MKKINPSQKVNARGNGFYGNLAQKRSAALPNCSFVASVMGAMVLSIGVILL
ncbi:hypothetical protein HY798_02985 [Candidatus Falkowbacteria bacterium]|nr:hypothetical protein [Candidatus Falkowbacteria bacterium]